MELFDSKATGVMAGERDAHPRTMPFRSLQDSLYRQAADERAEYQPIFNVLNAARRRASSKRLQTS